MVMAQPQTPDDVMVVREQTVDYNSTLGIPFGGFILNTGISVDATADDNVFLSEHNRSYDFITVTKPAIGLQSNWNRHSLFLGGQAVRRDYLKFNERDSDEYGALLSGTYHITYGTYMDASASTRHRSLTRGTEEDLSGSTPIEYNTQSQTLGFTRALSYLRAKIAWMHNMTERSDDLSSAVTGDFIKRDKHSAEATLSYEYLLNNELYIKMNQGYISYDLFGGSHRELEKTDIKYGWNFSFWDMYSGGLHFGHLHSVYSHLPNDYDDPYMGANINWAFSPLTTFAASTGRTYSDGDVSANEKIMTDTTRLVATHQITPFLTGGLTGSISDNVYSTPSDTTRTSNRVYGVGVEAKYKFSDNLGVKLGYDYRERNSDVVNNDYTNNRIMFSVTYMH